MWIVCIVNHFIEKSALHTEPSIFFAVSHSVFWMRTYLFNSLSIQAAFFFFFECKKAYYLNTLYETHPIKLWLSQNQPNCTIST